MDNGQNVDVEDQPPSQQENEIQQVPKEEPVPSIHLESEGNPWN